MRTGIIEIPATVKKILNCAANVNRDVINAEIYFIIDYKANPVTIIGKTY